MLTIKLPRAFEPELSYVLDVMLGQNLGIRDFQYVCIDGDLTHVTLHTLEGCIYLNNHFFNHCDESIYTEANLPKALVHSEIESKLTSFLYGEAGYNVEKNNYFIFGDMLGSAFFLLTQWEATIGDKDRLGRFKYTGSSIERLGIYHRCLVNEYVEILQILLQKIGVATHRQNYNAIFTCDVDSITKYSSLRNLIGGFRHRGLNSNVWNEYKASRKSKDKDVYYSFSYIFNKIGTKGIDSIFYFMADAEDKVFDTMDYELDEPLIQSVMLDLNQKGYRIGLHPSINTWQNKEKMHTQKVKLEEAAKHEIKDVRQHYLRYDVHTTFNHMEELGFTTDSSVQFTEGMGFAAGVCTPYNLFDLKSRRPLKIIELPLIMMKKKNYVKNVESEFNKYKHIIDCCKNHLGRYTFLFHNSDVETENERILFEEILRYV